MEAGRTVDCLYSFIWNRPRSLDGRSGLFRTLVRAKVVVCRCLLCSDLYRVYRKRKRVTSCDNLSTFQPALTGLLSFPFLSFHSRRDRVRASDVHAHIDSYTDKDIRHLMHLLSRTPRPGGFQVQEFPSSSPLSCLILPL